MKRWFTALLAAALLLTSTGCAGEGSAPPEQDMLYSSAEIQWNSDAESDPAESEEPEEPSSQESSSSRPESSSPSSSSQTSSSSKTGNSSSQPASSSGQAAGSSSKTESSSSQTPSSSSKPVSSSSKPVSSSSKASSSSRADSDRTPNSSAPSGEVRAVWFSYLDLSSMIKNKSKSDFESAIKRAFTNVMNDGYNTVFVQVRPFGDALYESDSFPWSYTLTGTEGEDPGYDPLSIMVKAAHDRGLEIEAWVNPYRIRTSANIKNELDEDSLAYYWLTEDTGEVIEYAGGIYYNPGSELAREHIINGVAEIVENYEVDGIHFDDYFYPTTDAAFDKTSYQDYKSGGGKLSLGDWRRENVNELVRETYAEIKRIDPSVRFGISPQGNTDINYNEQYIDVEEWLSSAGYLDYICPQIYYGFENDTCPFSATVKEWNSLIGSKNIDLYVGISASKIGLEDKWAGSGKNEWVENSNMLARMVAQARKSSHYAGFSMYSYRSLYAPAAGVADQVEEEKDALSELM